MAVGIDESARIDEAVVVGFIASRAAGGNHSRNEIVHFLATLAAQRKQHLAGFVGADRIGGNLRFEENLCRVDLAMWSSSC